MPRLRLGPVIKTRSETHLVSVNFSNVLPLAEIFQPAGSSVSSKRKDTGADSTTALLGATPAVVFVDAVAYIRLLAQGVPADAGRHLISLEAVTDVPSVFEAEIEVSIAQRNPIAFMTKFVDEVFNIGIDFDPDLFNAATPEEALSTVVATSRRKDTGVDTSADLLNLPAQIQGTVGAINLKSANTLLIRHIVTIQVTTDAVAVPDSIANVYEEDVEVVVEASP